MDIILLIFACLYISKQLKIKGYIPKPWVWRLVGLWILFEIVGGVISMLITHGNITMAAVFGFVCGLGAFLLIKSQVDKLPDITKTDWHDRLGDADHS